MSTRRLVLVGVAAIGVSCGTTRDEPDVASPVAAAAVDRPDAGQPNADRAPSSSPAGTASASSDPLSDEPDDDHRPGRHHEEAHTTMNDPAVDVSSDVSSDVRSRSSQSVTVASGEGRSTTDSTTERSVEITTEAGDVSARLVDDVIDVRIEDSAGWRSTREERPDGSISIRWSKPDASVDVLISLAGGSLVATTSSTVHGAGSR